MEYINFYESKFIIYHVTKIKKNNISWRILYLLVGPFCLSRGYFTTISTPNAYNAFYFFMGRLTNPMTQLKSQDALEKFLFGRLTPDHFSNRDNTMKNIFLFKNLYTLRYGAFVGFFTYRHLYVYFMAFSGFII